MREPDLGRRAAVLVTQRHLHDLAQHRRDRLLGVHERFAQDQPLGAQEGLGQTLEAIRRPRRGAPGRAADQQPPVLLEEHLRRQVRPVAEAQRLGLPIRADRRTRELVP